MKNGIKKGIVIPCYNEADRLKFAEFKSFIDDNEDYVLCFVNDGSQDDTLLQLLDFEQGNVDQVRVVNMARNQGKAEAVRSGMLDILSATDVDQVGFMDADLATDFIDYKRLAQELKTQDKQMVIGSRKLNGEQQIERSRFRSITSAAVGKVINAIIKMPIRDTQCGAKVFTRAAASYLFKTSFISRWLFDVELFIRIRDLYGDSVMQRITELALFNWTEVEGSKISLRESVKFPLRLMEIAYEYQLRPQIIDLMKSVGLHISISSKGALQ